ncbi:DUF2232 domain-containing protein [bacterium]|nr:DUF2232 domain-containing protein [bacterium]
MGSATTVLVSLLLLPAALTFPASVVLARERFGAGYGWAVLAVVALTSFAIGGVGLTAWMLAVFGVSAGTLVWGFRSGRDVEGIFLRAFVPTAGTMMLIAVLGLGAAGLTGGEIVDYIQGDQAAREKLLVEHEVVGPEQIADIRQRSGEGFTKALVLLPGLEIALAAIVIWVNMLSVIRFGRAGASFHGSADLSTWSAPEPLVFAVLVPALAAAGLDDPWIDATAGNVLIVAIVPFFFQGMAVTSHALRRLRIGPGLRVLAYVMLFAFMGAMVVPGQAALGVLDIWLDFRRLRASDKDTAPGDDSEP